jgi:hypothetical protein
MTTAMLRNAVDAVRDVVLQTLDIAKRKASVPLSSLVRLATVRPRARMTNHSRV